MNGKLREAIGFFTRETGIMDALAVSFRKGEFRERARDGRDAGERTLYDLASVTKIFTGICLMRLWEEGLLDPARRVTWYCPEFSGLACVTVEQLMGFQVQLRTEERIDGQRDREAALRCLRGVRAVGATGARAYSDIPAMVLKYVAEQVSSLSLWECVDRMILRPAGMRETFARVPRERVDDCLLYGPEYRVEGDKWIRREGMRRGIPHDPKAALLQGESGDLCGHAGLFSTLADLERLGDALLDGSLLTGESLRRIAQNRTGRQRADGTYTQYLGYCCYLKHPDQYYSEIPAGMGKHAFGIGGFTGNHFSVDPEQRRYTVFLGNRVRDRLTVVRPPEGKTLRDFGLREDGVGRICWTDGSVHPSSVNYVHQKDQHLHAVIEEILRRRGEEEETV